MHGIQTKARLVGLFALLTILGGVLAQGYVSNRLVDFNDAAVTANNLLAHQDLMQLGFAVFMFEMACQLAMTALFYEVLRPVNRTLNLVALVLGVTGCVVKALSRLFFIAPLLLLREGASYLTAFSAPQLQALSLLLLDINDRGAGMALIFFGFSTPLRGYLMFRSTFLPRVLGLLAIVSGLGWLTFLYRPLADRLFPYTAGFGLLASLVLIVWLLVFGVDEERWRRQAAANTL